MTTRRFYTGTTEYLSVTVTSSVTLNTQVVSLSLDGTTWLTAAWVGTAATRRKAQVLLNSGNSPTAPATRSVYVRVNDGTEVPVFKAEGIVSFEAPS